MCIAHLAACALSAMHARLATQQTQTEAMVDQRIDTFTHILSAFEVRATLLAEQGARRSACAAVCIAADA